MKDIVYSLITRINNDDLPLKETEKRFALYALSQAFCGPSLMVCVVPLKDCFYFLCDGKEDIEELREKIKKLFSAFVVDIPVISKKTSYLTLLEKVTIQTTGLRLKFNRKYVESWLKFKDEEDKKEFADI